MIQKSFALSTAELLADIVRSLRKKLARDPTEEEISEILPDEINNLLVPDIERLRRKALRNLLRKAHGKEYEVVNPTTGETSWVPAHKFICYEDTLGQTLVVTDDDATEWQASQQLHRMQENVLRVTQRMLAFEAWMDERFA